MTEGVPTPIRPPINIETPHPIIETVRNHADALKASLAQATTEGVHGAAEFLKALQELEQQHADLFPKTEVVKPQTMAMTAEVALDHPTQSAFHLDAASTTPVDYTVDVSTVHAANASTPLRMATAPLPEDPSESVDGLPEDKQKQKVDLTTPIGRQAELEYLTKVDLSKPEGRQRAIDYVNHLLQDNPTREERNNLFTIKAALDHLLAVQIRYIELDEQTITQLETEPPGWERDMNLNSAKTRIKALREEVDMASKKFQEQITPVREQKNDEAPEIHEAAEAPKMRELTAADIVERALESRASIKGQGPNRTFGDDPLFISPQAIEETFAGGLIDASRIKLESGPPLSTWGATSIVLKAYTPGGIEGLTHSSGNDDELPIVLKTPKGSDIQQRTITNWPEEMAKWEAYPREAASGWHVLSIIAEAGTLDSIRETQQKLYPERSSFVPDSVLIQDFGGAPALALEFLDGRYGLYNQLSTLSPNQRRSACIQYFQLQKVVIAAGLTCTDVKPTDVYYLPDDDRLVVLDWNVVHPIRRPLNREGIRNINDNFLQPLNMLPDQDGYGRFLSPAAKKVFSSLAERIQSHRQTVALNDDEIDEIIQGIAQLPIEAWNNH